MKVLPSIKSVFVKKIMDGRRLFGYRRTVYKNCNIDRIIVYSSNPACRIVGEFTVQDILCESPKALWEKIGGKPGVSKEYFEKYFKRRTTGYTIQIKSFHIYSVPKLLEEAYPGITPPQSFCYIKP